MKGAKVTKAFYEAGFNIGYKESAIYCAAVCVGTVHEEATVHRAEDVIYLTDTTSVVRSVQAKDYGFIEDSKNEQWAGSERKESLEL